MYILEIVPVLNDNYVYLIHNKQKNLTAVIDPGDPGPVINKLNEKNWKLDEILNTHHHGDHIGGNEKLIELYGSKLIAPKYDKDRISNITNFVSDNDVIEIAGFKTKVIYTPGHTLGHVCYFLEKEKILFSGDTLFRLGCGRVFEGSMKQMKQSLDRLTILPDNTTVYCGHEYTLSNAKFCLNLQPKNKYLNNKYKEILKIRENNNPTIPFTLKEEKKLNPFLQCNNIDFRESINLKNENSIDTFTFIRNKKDNF